MHHRIYHTSSNSNECLGEIARYAVDIELKCTQTIHSFPLCAYLPILRLYRPLRCILIRESSELRHLKKLESALIDIRGLDQVQPRPQSAGNKAYQTMKCKYGIACPLHFDQSKFLLFVQIYRKSFSNPKCLVPGMMTLKRKLKRIRQNKEHQAESMQSDCDVGTTTKKD